MSKEINFILDDWHFFFVDRLWWDSIISCYFVWNVLRNIDLFAHVFALVVIAVAVAVALLPSFLTSIAANRIEMKCGTNILNQKGTLTRKNPVALLDLIYAIFLRGGVQLTANNVFLRKKDKDTQIKVQPKTPLTTKEQKKNPSETCWKWETNECAHFTSSWIHPKHQTGIE